MGHQLISADAFRSQMKGKKYPAGIRVQSDDAHPIAKDVGFVEKAPDGSTLFILSTGTPDRSNDVVEQSGWELDNFRPNPVVLFAHDHGSLPVARSPNVYVDEKNRLVSKGPVFTSEEVNPFGAMVGKMVDAGFLRATSVGFIPLEWTWNEERGMFAMDFKRQELIEWSVVPVPANPEALIGAKSAGIDCGPLLAWASKALDEKRGAGILGPEQLAYIAKALAPKAHQVPAAVTREPGAATVCMCDAGPLVKCQECGGHKRAAISDDAYPQDGDKAIQALTKRVEALEKKPAPPAAPVKTVAEAKAEQDEFLKSVAAAAAAQAKEAVNKLLGRVS